MLMIRLQRVGRKHEPTFRVVLTDSKNSTKSGKFAEILGSYDPRKKTEAFEGDRIKALMQNGAQLSGTVHNLLVSHKIIEGKKKNVLPYKKPFKSEAKIAEESAAAKALADKAAEEKAAAEAAAAPVVEEVPAPVVEETPDTIVAEEQATEPAPEVVAEPVAEAPTEEPAA